MPRYSIDGSRIASRDGADLFSKFGARSGLTALILSAVSPDLLRKALSHPKFGKALGIILAAPVIGNLAWSTILTLWTYLLAYFSATMTIQTGDSLRKFTPSRLVQPSTPNSGF